jgi:hypothetical protein
MFYIRNSSPRDPLGLAARGETVQQKFEFITAMSQGTSYTVATRDYLLVADIAALRIDGQLGLRTMGQFITRLKAFDTGTWT